MSKTVTLAELQARPLELLEKAYAKQEDLIVVKDGRPIVRIVPAPNPSIRRSLDELRALGGQIHGDIVEQLD